MAKALSSSSFCFWMFPRRSYALPRLERVVATSQWSGPNSRSCTTQYRWSWGPGRLQKITHWKSRGMYQLTYQPNIALTKKMDELAVGMRCMRSSSGVLWVQWVAFQFLFKCMFQVSNCCTRRKTQHLRNNQETRINDISAISTQWSTCREWDMSPSWISRAFSKWSLSCAASPQRPYLYRVTRWWSTGVKTTEDWLD